MESVMGDMPGMGDMPSMTPNNTMKEDSMMMHMTFFWGSKDVQILFSDWPGHSQGMYIFALLLVFLACFLLEWLSHLHLLKPDTPPVLSGLFQTGLHIFRVGLAYLVMLAVMSFNGGVFLAAVAGHALGFFLFGSAVFKRSRAADADKPNGLC